jgi:hypothetical protein
VPVEAAAIWMPIMRALALLTSDLVLVNGSALVFCSVLGVVHPEATYSSR